MRRSEWPRQGPRTRACSRTGPLLSPGRPPQPLLNSPVGLAAAACCLCAVCALSGRAEHITFTAHAGRVAPHPVASSARPEGCCSSCTLLTRALLFFQCTHAAGCAKCCSCAASALSGRSEHTLETAHAGGAAPSPLACVAPPVWRCRSLRPLEHAPLILTAHMLLVVAECCSCAASALSGRSEHTLETAHAGGAAAYPLACVAPPVWRCRSLRPLERAPRLFTAQAGACECCSRAASALSGRSEHTVETPRAGRAAPHRASRLLCAIAGPFVGCTRAHARTPQDPT